MKKENIGKALKLLSLLCNIATVAIGCFFPPVLMCFISLYNFLSRLWILGILIGCGFNFGIYRGTLRYVTVLWCSTIMLPVATLLAVNLVSNPIPLLIIISLVTLIFAIKNTAYLIECLFPHDPITNKNDLEEQKDDERKCIKANGRYTIMDKARVITKAPGRRILDADIDGWVKTSVL